MEKYLLEYYRENIIDLMRSAVDAAIFPNHVSLVVNLTHLKRVDKKLFQTFIYNAQNQRILWNQSLLCVQKTIFKAVSTYPIKYNCHVRFAHLPCVKREKKIKFTCQDLNKVFQIEGCVIRKGEKKFIELKRNYVCARCKKMNLCNADYNNMFVIEPPTVCPDTNCKGMLRQESEEPIPQNCFDYQELRVQLTNEDNESFSYVVTLENDLVDFCQPGDEITICGTVERRRQYFKEDRPMKLCFHFRCLGITQKVNESITDENIYEAQLKWHSLVDKHGEAVTRETFVKSIAPNVIGLDLVKLAIVLAMASNKSQEISKRNQSHLLLVGDPGLAKSELLKCAASLSPRGVYVTATGCTSAGLTAAALKEDGEWHLEAGALVRADRSICCIDEFNRMAVGDQTSMLEAMEQQKLTVAKGGFVCSLNTRCSIIAAANAKKLRSLSEKSDQDIDPEDIGIPPPLLSRFDLVFILCDEFDEEWDQNLIDCAFLNEPLGTLAPLWSEDEIRLHFRAIECCHPKMAPHANEILAKYYKTCRASIIRNKAMTSVRFYDGLVRLTLSHARFMLRETAIITDAQMAIRLVESTWGFKSIVSDGPKNIVRKPLTVSSSVGTNLKVMYPLFSTGAQKLIEPEHSKKDYNSIPRSLKRKFEPTTDFSSLLTTNLQLKQPKCEVDPVPSQATKNSSLIL